MEETVLTATLLVVVILLGWSLVGSGPALSKSFQRLGRLVPKKEGWRARWGMQGPLPRDYRGRNIWDSYAVLADEGRMEFLVMGGKKLAHGANKGTFYTFGGIGAVFCLVLSLGLFDPMTLEDWLTYLFCWAITICLFAIGYHYQRKENKEEDTPNFVFDRDHGTVTVPAVDKLPTGEYRFEDVEGYFVKGPVNKFGLSNYYLQLVVYTPGTEEEIGHFFLWAGPIISYEQALAHWSRLCQFMNKS